MRTSALFGAKTPDFLKFMACSHERGGGWTSADICGQGERGSIFR